MLISFFGIPVYSAHRTLHTALLHTTHCILHTTHHTLHTTHCTPHTTHHTPHTTHRNYTMHTTHRTSHTAHCILHTAHRTPHFYTRAIFLNRIARSHTRSYVHNTPHTAHQHTARTHTHTVPPDLINIYLIYGPCCYASRGLLTWRTYLDLRVMYSIPRYVHTIQCTV